MSFSFFQIMFPTLLISSLQEGYLAKHAVSEDDRVAAEAGLEDNGPMDPMQGLEGLDVAGPKLA